MKNAVLGGGACCGCMGMTLLIVGLVMSGVILQALETRLHDSLIIKPESEDSESYNKWRDPFNHDPDRAVKYTKIYMFNLTNLDAVLTSGDVPNFEEIGPYTYKVEAEYYNVSFLNDSTEVRYRTNTMHYFNAEKSCSTCKESDIVIQLNPVISKLYLGLYGSAPSYATRDNLIYAGAESFFSLWTKSLEGVYTSSSGATTAKLMTARHLSQPASNGLGPTLTQNAAFGLLQRSDLSSGAAAMLSAFAGQSSYEPGYTTALSGHSLLYQWIYNTTKNDNCKMKDTGCFLKTLGVFSATLNALLAADSAYATAVSTGDTTTAATRLNANSVTACTSMASTYPSFSGYASDCVIVMAWLKDFSSKSLLAYLSLTKAVSMTNKAGWAWQKKSVHEWVIYYEDPALKADPTANPNLGVLGNRTLASILESSSSIAKYAGKFEILKTGKSNINDLQTQVGFKNHLNYLPRWSKTTKTGFCAGATKIMGRNIKFLFGPGVKNGFEWESMVDGSDRTIFVSQIYRKVSVSMMGETEYQDLPVKKYSLKPSALEVDPAYDMMYGGVQPLKCPLNFLGPIHVTKPHFYGANITDSQKATGISVGSKADDVTVLVEPTTGASIYGVNQLQNNFRMQRRWVSSSTSADQIFLPFYYQYEETAPASKSIDNLKLINRAIDVSHDLFISACTAGVICLVLGIALILFALLCMKSEGGLPVASKSPTAHSPGHAQSAQGLTSPSLGMKMTAKGQKYVV